MAKRPIFADRHTVFHGFGRSVSQTSPAIEPFTWWGSDRFKLLAETRERNVRLQAEDGCHSGGVLYARGG